MRGDTVARRRRRGAHAASSELRRSRRRLRRRRGDAREGGRAEVLRLVHGAPRRRARQARDRRRLARETRSAHRGHLGARRHDWTGNDEAHWLGWLDEPLHVAGGARRASSASPSRSDDEVDDVVLCGMGGSSLAPEVLRRSFDVDWFHVLDTTHPKAIRALEEKLDLERTLFVSSSKSGTTLETRSHTDYFWEQTGKRATAVLRRHRSRLRARASRPRARLPARSSPASRRSAAATRRSRRSGSCPRC